MITLELTKQDFEKKIQEYLNVTNPVLLKSGVLGLLTDYLANIKYDISQFYTKTFREMNVGLAQDFNSMLFHSTIYRTDVQLANPATFGISFIIPEINTDNIKYQKFNIEKNTVFKDTNDIEYFIPERIEIIVSKTKYQAFVYTDIDKKELVVTRAPDPLNPGKVIYLINYENLKQLKRTFKKIIVPYYNIGDSFIFSQSIDDYTGLVSVKAWWNNSGEPANINIIEKYNSETISGVFNYPEFDIKYYKFGSSKYDLDLFLQIFKNNITLETGNGIVGKYLNNNTEIILEVITCLGEAGNLKNMTFSIEGVTTEIIDEQENARIFDVIINGVSGVGGEGGSNIATSDEIRNNIFDKITFRNSLTSINDYEIFFKYNGFRPFVDAKFLDARSFIFVFNALMDNKRILKTTSINVPEYDLLLNPFYPEVNIDGVDLISPFYYKFLSNNETEAYIVNPQIPIKLTADITNTTDAVEETITNQIGLELRYDFDRRKSYFKLSYGADPNKSYRVQTGYFSFTLDYSNNFTWEVNTLFTDDYCIITKEITDLVVDIYDLNNSLLLTLKSYENYYQLISTQIMYKYYQVDETASNLALQLDSTPLSDSYLDNELRSLLISADEIIDPLTQGEIPIVLRLPYMEKDYFNSDWTKVYTNLTSFFKVNDALSKTGFNTRVVQSFYNTITIPTKYQTDIFKENNNFNKSNPELSIAINVYIDKEAFTIDNNFETLSDLSLSLKIDIIEFFKQKVGFQVEYFESELETYIYAKYNTTDSGIKFLKNIEVLTPKLYQVHDSDTIFYNMKNNPELTFDDLIEFTPPFFYYDLDNIDLQIKI